MRRVNALLAERFLSDVGQRLRLGSFLAAIAIALMVIGVFLTADVLNNLKRLKDTSSDNIQWTVTQVEVEMLDLINAITLSIYEPNADIENVRIEFDILYTRVQTLYGSPMLDQITSFGPFATSLVELQSYLDEVIPIIDGDDTSLRANLPQLLELSDTMRLDVRKLAVVGLAGFAQRSDERRQEIAFALIRLGGLAVMLVAALVGLVLYMLTIYRQTRDTGVALAEANQRMNTILTTSLDGVIVTDFSGKIVEFNEAAQAIFDISETAARTIQIRDLFASDDLNWFRGPQLFGNTYPKNQIVGQGRMQLDAFRNDGTSFPAEIALQNASDGGQTLYVAFVRDISKRVADEQELVEARDRALAGEKAKAGFLTVMSHEIRTPLNGLLGNLSLLNETPLTQSQSQYIRNMTVSGNVLMRHVDSVLDLARFEAGKTAFSLETTDLSALIQNVIDGQRGLAASSGTDISWRWVGLPTRWIITDASALEQVLLNLLGNAIKFTDGGQVIIELEATPIPNMLNKITLETRVVDTGIGIPEEDLEKVFADFVTQDASFGRTAGGSGLGLGISRRIVEALGGEIGVESTLGTGSVFWFRLPLDISSRRSTHKTNLQPADHIKPLNILVIEDNEINRAVTCEMLKNDGHSVLCVADGASGVRAARDDLFDAILMDISMPVMDGLQATQSIRADNAASRYTPIIAFSANVMASAQDDFAKAGMNGFLSKPLNREQLRTTLSRIRTDSAGAQMWAFQRPQILDSDQLDSTRTSLGDEVLLPLVRRFQAEVSEVVEQLCGANSAHLDADTIRNLAHKHASSAAIFGTTALRNTLLDLENAAQSQNQEKTAKYLTELPDVWQKTYTALRKLTLVS